jgi:hypothetical protein
MGYFWSVLYLIASLRQTIRTLPQDTLLRDRVEKIPRWHDAVAYTIENGHHTMGDFKVGVNTGV